MNLTRSVLVVVIVGLSLHAVWLAGPAARPAAAHEPPATSTRSGHAHGSHAHEHPPVPAAYADAHLPPGAWTDPALLAANLPVKPPDLTHAGVVAEMPGNYWVWRVSEGGLVEPFKSKGSTMPTG